MDYFDSLIEVNKVSNAQTQSICNIEREIPVGGYTGRQV